jgi:ATP-dependent Clp protease protease subunit
MKLFLMLLFLSVNAIAAEKEILLTSKNTITLRGPVTRESVGEVMHELNALAKEGEPSDPIYLILNTPGGSVMAGLDLIEFMNKLRRPVFSVAKYAASMGFHILQNSPRRYVTKYATIMSHRASGGFQGDIPQQVGSRLKHIIDLIEKMDEQVISRTNGKYTKNEYAELIRDEYYAVGNNAVEDKFADEVVSLKCDSSLDGLVEKTVQSFIFTFKVKLSRCPLLTEPVIEQNQDTGKIIEYLEGKRTLEP